MPTDSAISQYIVSMGLSLSLSIYIAFRAGRRLRNLTTENMEERLSDFTFDSLKELIADKLQTLLESEGIPLPAGISIKALIFKRGWHILYRQWDNLRRGDL